MLAILRVVIYYRDMSKTPISKSQKRAMSLLGLAQVDGYDAAATSLEAVDCYRDGVPMGQTWRTAAKLNDADLLAGLRRVEAAPHMSAIDIIEYGF